MNTSKSGFHKRLEEASKGVTRQALAKRAGASVGAVSDWFTKGAWPRGDIMLRLPESLGVSADWLFYGRGPRDLQPENGVADPYTAGMAYLASRVIDAIEGALKQEAPPNGRGEDGAIFREAANRLREIGASARSVRQHEGSESH